MLTLYVIIAIMVIIVSHCASWNRCRPRLMYNNNTYGDNSDGASSLQ